MKPFILGGGHHVGFEHYPKANLKWPGFIENGERSIEGVSLALNPNQAYIRCAQPLKLYEVFEITRETLQTIVIEQDEVGSKAA
jgi:hypothetical protein